MRKSRCPACPAATIPVCPNSATELMKRFQERRVSVSLPSLRVDSFVQDTLQQTQKVKKTTLTFAPEAGSQRLRDVINKGVTEEDLTRTRRATRSRAAGAVGNTVHRCWACRPRRTGDRARHLSELARDVVRPVLLLRAAVSSARRGLRVAVTASAFVPEEPYAVSSGRRRRTTTQGRCADQQHYLIGRSFRNIKGVDYKYHARGRQRVSRPCLARGDRRICRVLENAPSPGLSF